MQILEIIMNYRDFLSASWPTLTNVLNDIDWDENPYFIDEWMQANWEILVERQLGLDVTLLPYGFDLKQRARYQDSEKVANYRIICLQQSGERQIFLCFTGKIDNRFELAPPFDYAYVEEMEKPRRFGIPLEGLRFEIESLK